MNLQILYIETVIGSSTCVAVKAGMNVLNVTRERIEFGRRPCLGVINTARCTFLFLVDSKRRKEIGEYKSKPTEVQASWSLVHVYSVLIYCSNIWACQS